MSALSLYPAQSRPARVTVPPSSGRRRRGVVHILALALVWIGVASGAVVFTEPAPVDILTIGLIVVLPLIGLVAIKPGLVVMLSVWLAGAGAAFVASMFSNDVARSSIHSGISLYLYVATFVLAAFVARRPTAHTKLILHAYQWAALIAAGAGIVGYFGLLPGAEDLFTKFSRAAGTFKDPNVYGPFLVPAILLSLHQCLTRQASRTILPAAMLAILGLAILLSFSRGAWFNLAVAVAIYGYVMFVTTPTDRQRLKMVSLALLAASLVSLGIAAALHSDSVGRLLQERAQLSQSYDVGPEGRFGGQEKAKGLILDNPFGIGAGTFTEVYHHEDVHNVYLSMFLNAGWAGGLVFALMCLIITVFGLRHAFRRTATQALFVIGFAALVGNILEGFIIDIDHWRHFYLEMAIVWGLMLGDRRVASATTMAAIRHRPPRVLKPVAGPHSLRMPRIMGRAPVRLTGVPPALMCRPRTGSPRRPNRLAPG